MLLMLWSNSRFHPLLKILALLITIACQVLFIFNSVAAGEVREAIVKIYSVTNAPDYDNPWNMHGPQSVTGSGCIIEGNRILTNAHVVSNQTFIQVRLHGHSKKYTARMVAVSHEADLALLKVNDPGFFQKTAPIPLGELPQVQEKVLVYGFPAGGDMLSTTAGVISRIEHQVYAHSLYKLLAAQLDAAINPGNSGGPVVVDNRIVGVVMQTLKQSENIGYMVPVPIIRHFLEDLKDGRYEGFPEEGIVVQTMENENLKQMHGLEEDQSGALVVGTLPESPADGKILAGDILLAIDGHPVADDCTVEFRPKERTHMSYYIQLHQVGDHLDLTLLRNGETYSVALHLTDPWGKHRLVPMTRYDERPSYFIYGGLVFSPLTLNYIQTWGNNWGEYAPSNLINYFVNSRPEIKGEEAVILIKVLTSDVNNGYENFVNKRIAKVNGNKVKNLKAMVHAIQTAAEGDFVVFENEFGSIMALDRKKAEMEQSGILQVYDILKDRSDDLLGSLTTPQTASENPELADVSAADP